MDLGTFPAPEDGLSEGKGLNDAGDVVGLAYTRYHNNPLPVANPVGHPVVFSGGIANDLGTLFATNGISYPEGVAYDINNDGVIVGVARVDAAHTRPFVYANGVMTDLGSFGGITGSAFAINDAGTIVGRSFLNSQTGHAFVYDNGTMVDIGGSAAFDINQQGQVVGNSGPRGFLYSDGVMQDLGSAIPYRINDRGLIVGDMFDPEISLDVRAGYYENGSWHSMGILGGSGPEVWDIFSEARAVNNRDQIVGLSTTDDNDAGQAFIYTNGVMHDLISVLGPDSGWTRLDVANAINDRGQITGRGRTADGATHAFLMTPTLDEFQLDVTYANPLALEGDGSDLPAEVTAHFVLEGIAGMSGAFRLEDVVSALVEFGDGVWTEVDLTSFHMTLGPGGVDEILDLGYNFGSLFTPSGLQLSLHNNSFQLYVDGVDSNSGQQFSYF